jgi:metallo-beta-lactamase family protein
MQIEFLGAAQTVTGSMHLIHTNGRRILLDCGMFQGKRAESNERNKNFPFDPKDIDAVILSHAHIDHSGNLPNLVKQGFSGKIYCTPATRDLCGIMLADSAHIQEKDAEFFNKQPHNRKEPPIEPLYRVGDAMAAMDQFKTVLYKREFDVFNNVTAQFIDAGHILGSASVKMTATENGSTKTLGFSGDIGRWGMPIIRDPEFMGNVEALITESTYGGVLHDPPDNMEFSLLADLNRTIKRKGKIIVPAFSIGRTQDLLYSLHRLFDQGRLPRIPIYVDSPLASNATQIYKKHPECYDEETKKLFSGHTDPFGFAGVQYVQSAEESKRLNVKKESCMIISASGMCEAGRILHHLANNVENPKNTIMMIGFCAEHTLGRRIIDKSPEVKIFGARFSLRAEVVVHNSFSAHADNDELMRYINRFDKQALANIFVVHGEPEKSAQFAANLGTAGFKHVEIPKLGEKVDI